jgi:hypothetical protein
VKRDPHLIRALLLHLEEKQNDRPAMPSIVPYSKLEVLYHLLLMHEVGFVRCEIEKAKSGRVIRVLPFSLTWRGHEFLDASRNEKLWKRATQLGAKKLGGVPFDVLLALLVQLAKDQLGIT